MKAILANVAVICGYMTVASVLFGLINFLVVASSQGVEAWDFSDLNHYLWFGISAAVGVFSAYYAENMK